MKSLPSAGGVKPIDADLATGMRHLAEANMSLLRQRRMIWRLAAKDEPTADAEETFNDMIQTLRIMRERLAILEIAGDAAHSPLAALGPKPAAKPVGLAAMRPGKTGTDNPR